jgi:hypothetical protein
MAGYAEKRYAVKTSSVPTGETLLRLELAAAPATGEQLVIDAMDVALGDQGVVEVCSYDGNDYVAAAAAGVFHTAGSQRWASPIVLPANTAAYLVVSLPTAAPSDGVYVGANLAYRVLMEGAVDWSARQGGMVWLRE